MGQAGLAAPRLPLAAFSSVNNLFKVASLLGQLMRLPGIAALRRAGGAPESGVSAPIAGHSNLPGRGQRVLPGTCGQAGRAPDGSSAVRCSTGSGGSDLVHHIHHAFNVPG